MAVSIKSDSKPETIGSEPSHDAPLPIGSRNENPRGIGLLALLAEDYRTHDRHLLEPGFLAVAVHRLGNARMEVSGNGLVAAYIHTGAKVGVLVEVGAGKESTVTTDDFKQLVKDITLQIAAGSPFVVSREQVAPAVVAKEKEIAAEQVKNKPPQAIAKIVEGKLEKFYQTYCLVDQGFVKKNSEISVKEHAATVAKLLGDEVTIRRFVRFQVGETPAA